MNRPTLAIAATIGALLLSGCNRKKNEFVPPPPPAVNVQKPLVESTGVYIDFPANTRAFEKVEIRARVKGFLKSQDFQPGQFVEKGKTLLFTIEPEQFEAAVAAANGSLAKAEADLEIATTNWEKRRAAFEKSQAVSEIDVLSAKAEMGAAAAAIDIAKASLADAERDLSYTRIFSPVSGRVSKAEVDVGNLVGAAEPTLLTNVVVDHPLYVDFEISERMALNQLDERPTPERPQLGADALARKLRLTLSDGSIHPEAGKFDFIDNAVNPDTGTITARALFDNSAGRLAAGLFARIGIPRQIENAVMIPRAAIQRDIGGTYVLVIGEGNQVQRRMVTTSQFTKGDLHIVEEGLGANDRVVVSNLQRVRDGVVANPTEMPPPVLAADPGKAGAISPSGAPQGAVGLESAGGVAERQIRSENPRQGESTSQTK